ncbi:MAG: metalloregulator ArsR/SmtB family transcription factor [Glaciecola sp.]
MTPLSFFKCLADDTRLKCLLLICSVSECCVCDLMSALKLEQPKISRHLAELRKCGILQDTRKGKWVYYQLHPQLAQWARDIITHTANTNPPYFDQQLTALQQSIQSRPPCC